MGPQHSAPEPARLFRELKEERGGGHQPRYEDQHGGYHAEGQGARKELHQLNGGVSGIAGSFIGFSYSTNNFLGLGETLSIDSQLGDRIRNVTFGFTEPYFLDQADAGGLHDLHDALQLRSGPRSLAAVGPNLCRCSTSSGTQNLLNYVSNGYGFTTFLSYPMKKRSFARVGLSYGYDTSNITTLSEASKTYFQYLNFQERSAEHAAGHSHQQGRSVVQLQHGQPSDHARRAANRCSFRPRSRAACLAATST